MLTVSPNALASYERDAAVRRKQRYVRWLASLAAARGHYAPDQAVFAFDAAQPEAARAEIDTEERLFVHALARLLMPEMSGLQYMQTMDVVFSPLDDEQRVRTLLEIRDRTGG